MPSGFATYYILLQQLLSRTAFPYAKSPSASWVGLRNKAKPPLQWVVRRRRTGAHTLVEKAQIARQDGHSLVSLGAHHLAVADALGPRSPSESHIVSTREGIGLRGGKIVRCASKTTWNWLGS